MAAELERSPDLDPQTRADVAKAYIADAILSALTEERESAMEPEPPTREEFQSVFDRYQQRIISEHDELLRQWNNKPKS